MVDWETPGWLARWPQCRLLLELARVSVRTGRPEALARLRLRLQVCRIRMRGAPVLVDNTLSELWLAVGLALEGDLSAARRHTHEAGWKAQRVEGLRRAEMRRKARVVCHEARLLRARTRQLLAQSATRMATAQGTGDLPEPAVAASIA
ncbi:MAG TPA: hypothetical protein VGR07_21665 [Thermoanaerobaculia bacterium]|jgi:hypothetical protein|nr:hypothetical protein [Thermoanaerobaculia bacterium]